MHLLVLSFDDGVCRGVEFFVPFEEGQTHDEHVCDSLATLLGDEFTRCLG
jgi:hypothetical protein